MAQLVRRATAVAAAAAVAGVVSLVDPGPASAITPAHQAAPAPGAQHPFRGQAGPRSWGARLTRPLGPDEATVVVMLRQSDAQQQVITELSSVGGVLPDRAARFRRSLPSDQQRDAVAAWAGALGFRVAYRGNFMVELAGEPRLLAAAFGTTLGPVRQAARVHQVAQSGLVVPAALTGSVTAAVGLDDRPLTAHATTLPYEGSDAQAIGRFPNAPSSTLGSGVTVATVNLSGWYYGDVQQYAGDRGMTLRSDQISYTLVGGGTNAADPAGDTGDSAEVALDAEAILGAAPGADQLQYFGGNTGADELAVLDQMSGDAAQGFLQVVSDSWGRCETHASAGQRNAESTAIQRITAAGATFFAASGDGGSADCSDIDPSDTSQQVDLPAVSPYAVAVGGTRVERSGADFGYTGWAGSGGGPSHYFAAPAWQTSLGSTARSVPDIGALADPGTGYAVYDSYGGGDEVAGGTSLAAPLSAAGLAATESALATGPLGNILPTLYSHRAGFIDVTVGNNGRYAAGVGYDYVTGLGSPDWSALGAVFAGSPTPSPSASPTASPSGSPSVSPSATASPSGPTTASPTASAPPGGSSYHAVAPFRLVDSRTGVGFHGPLAGHGSVVLQVVGGSSPVPAGASSVALNTTVTDTAGDGYLSVAPALSTQTSNLNWARGRTIPNLVISALSAAGTVTVYNGSGSPVDVVADIQGYSTPDSAGSSYHAVPPFRLVDSRSGVGFQGPLPGHRSVVIQVVGDGAPVPPGASSVALNTTVTDTAGDGYLSVAPALSTQTSNLNWARGRTIPNLVISALSAAGTVTVYNGSGSPVDVVADIQGYSTPDSAGSSYHAVPPFRLVDSRSGVGFHGPLSGHGSVVLQIVGGSSPVPAGASSVALNTTVTDTAGDGYLSVAPALSSATSNLNWPRGDTVPNLVISALSATGTVTVYNGSASPVDVVADVQGYSFG